MGIILGALGGMGQAGMQVGQAMMHAGLEEELQKQRAALAEQSQQNMLKYQQQLRLDERNRVAGIIKNATQAGTQRAYDDGPNTPAMLDTAGNKAAQQALIESGDIDSAKILGDMGNKEGLLALKEQQMQHDASYRDQLIQLRQQAAENAAKLASEKLAYQQSSYEARKQALDAQTEYRDAVKGLNEQKTQALREKALDSFFGAREKELLKQAEDPANKLDPVKSASIATAIDEISAMKSGTIQLMEDGDLSPARAHQLVVGLDKGTTKVFKDKQTGELFIDAGNGKPTPLPPGLRFLLEKSRPGAANKPQPQSAPSAPYIRAPFSEESRTDPLGNPY